MTQKANPAASRLTRGGRPRKFVEPSHPITITLPERTLKKLTVINKDRAKAIASVVDRAVPDTDMQPLLAEVIRVGPGIGLVLVGPCRHLHNIEGLRMIEIMPTRHLLSIKSGMAPALIEVALMDMLERIPENDHSDRILITKLVSILRSTRQLRRMNKEEILIVDTN